MRPWDSIEETSEVLQQVANERDAQWRQWGDQSYPNGTQANFAIYADAARFVCDRNHGIGVGTWLNILAEEFFEAASETDPEKLEVELTQLAAVATAWIEDLQRKKQK